jgi:hypothetical protein
MCVNTYSLVKESMRYTCIIYSLSIFFSTGKQHDDLKKKNMDKTLEITLKSSINTKLPTCDDKGVFTVKTPLSSMMMTPTGNTSFVSKRFVNEIIKRLD